MTNRQWNLAILALVLAGALAMLLVLGPVGGGAAILGVLAARVLFVVVSDRRTSAEVEFARREFLKAGYLQSEGLDKEAIEGYDRLLPTLHSLQRESPPQLTSPLRTVLMNRAVALAEAGRWAEALASIAELVDLCEGAEDLDGRIYLGQTYLFRGFERDAAGAVDEANAEAERLFVRFRDSDEPSLRALAAQGLLQEGVRLSRQGRYEEALEVNARLIERFEGETDWEVLRVVADATHNRAYEYWKAGHSHEAIAEYQRVVAWMSGRPEARVIVCRALVGEGALLQSIGESNRAIATNQRAMELGSGSVEDEVRALMAHALFGSGNCLYSLGRDQEALSSYDAAIDRYRDLPAAAVEVTKAMASRASLLFDLGRCEEALAGCRDVRARIRPSDAWARQSLDLVNWIERQCADTLPGE